MKILSEFQKFFSRGNVVDLAVAVIVGGAFQKIVSSLVADVLMPPLGLLIGGIHFSELKLRIGGTAEAPVTLNYGAFGQSLINFLILAFAVFLLVKLRNALLRQREEAKEAEPSAPPKEELLLTEIRDLLKQANERAKS